MTNNCQFCQKLLKWLISTDKLTKHLLQLKTRTCLILYNFIAPCAQWANIKFQMNATYSFNRNDIKPHAFTIHYILFFELNRANRYFYSVQTFVYVLFKSFAYFYEWQIWEQSLLCHIKSSSVACMYKLIFNKLYHYFFFNVSLWFTAFIEKRFPSQFTHVNKVLPISFCRQTALVVFWSPAVVDQGEGVGVGTPLLFRQ